MEEDNVNIFKEKMFSDFNQNGIFDNLKVNDLKRHKLDLNFWKNYKLKQIILLLPPAIKLL